MLRIGIDGRALQGRRTGVGRYVFELCRELDEQLQDAAFFVYSNKPVEMPVLSDRWTLRLDPLSWAAKLKSVLWLKLRCGALCRQDDLDVFWGAATFLPSLPHTVRTIVTVYDLNYKIVPETMSRTHLWGFKLFFSRDILRSDIVTAISEGSSSRLHGFVGRSADAIVYPAIDAAFRPQSDSAIQDLLDKHSFSRPYLLAVATWEPRKNLELLIRVFLDMKSRGELPGRKLVLVGGRGWKDERLVGLLAGTDSVVPLGYVPDEDLPALYSGAELFVFPSIYEGFGMPVLEAAACGARVVASDIPEVREAGGANATYTEPTANGICRGIVRALSEKPAQYEAADELTSWKKSAENLVSIIIGNK